MRNNPELRFGFYKRMSFFRYVLGVFLLSFLISPDNSYACPGNANFTVSNPHCTTSPVTFTNTSTGGPLTYSWDFGDPGSGGQNTSTLTNPTHLFSTFGWFTVCLVAHYALGCTDTLCQTIVVIQGPTAGYTWTPNNQCATIPVDFTSTSTGAISYQWNFGDPLSLGNNNSTLPNPSHLFTATGGGTQTYIVSLTVTGPGGCTNSIAQTTTVLQKPDASVADLLTNFNNCTSATSGNPAFSLTVTNISTTQGSNTDYHIDWGDGTQPFDTTGDYVSTPHTYANLGIYFLISTVTGANGCITIDTFKVLNISNPSIGMSSLGGTAGCGPVTYCFPVSSFQNNDTSTKYKFDFGDGSPIVIYNHPPPDTVCHTYDSTSCASPGSQFVATVTAVDACDSTMSTVNNIKVFMSAIPVFTVGPDTIGCVNQPFTFTNSSVSGFNNVCNTSAVFTWNFGDGSPPVTTNNTNPQTHTYTFTGLFTVTLTASNYCNNNAIDSVHVCVNAPPIMSFSVDNLTGCAPLDVQSNNTTTSVNVCGPTNYLWAVTYNGSLCNPMTGIWSFQIGSDSASVNPAFTFTDPGSYSISLTANNGCIVPPDTLSILVKTIPTVVITPIPDTCGTATVMASATFVNCYGNNETYQWSFPGGNPNSSTLQNPPSVFYGAQGNYIITASSTNECGTFDTTTSFNVNPLPNVNITASSDSICSGQSTTLTATGAVTYSWSPPIGLNTTTGPVVIATPPTTTTYTATGINGANCTDSFSITINVTPSPSVTVGASAIDICIGGNSTLTANGANTYTWSPALGLNTTVGAVVIASPLTTTTYTVIGTSGNGCEDSATVTIIVHPLPTITVNPPNPSICIGGSVNLTAGGAAFFAWTPGTGLNTTVGPNVTANPATTTTYTVTGTTGVGCVNTTTVTVTVNTLPNVVASASNYNICIGSSTTLTGTGANTYTWAPNVNLSSTSGSPITASPTSTITYTCTGSSGVGCVATDTVIVYVNPLPTINVNAVSPTICIGSSTNVTASGAVNYSWFPGTGLNTTVGATVTANPITTTTYTVTGTDANGCVNTDSITITVNPLPIVNVSSQFGSICAGSSTTLTATGANTYSWAPNTGLNTTVGAVVTATINNTTTYTVTGTDANGCVNTANVTVNVYPLPNVVASAIDYSICFGMITTLNASGANSYTWAPPNGLSATTGSSVIADPVTTTTYTATGTDGNGCVNTDTVIVIVNPLPNITVNAVSPGICFGDSTQLNAGGAVTYSWAPTTGLSSSTGASVYAHPLITTTYTVTGTDVNGCVNSNSVTVTVHPLPTIDITASINPICIGQSTILTATGANTYSWAPNTGLNTTVGAVVTATPNTSINYTVTGTDGFGCVNTYTIGITVNPLPTIIASASLNAICLGDSTTLSASGGVNYIWTPNTELNTNIGPVVDAGPNSNITYTVTGTDGFGCVNTATVPITVNQLPVVTVTPASATVCFGDSVLLTASGATTYSWSPLSGLSATTGTSVYAQPPNTTTYTVIGTDGLGCSSSRNVTVTVNPLPNVSAIATPDIICFGQSSSITASGANTYSWSPGTGLNTTTGTTVISTPVTSIVYTVTGTDGNGCINTNTVSVTVNPLPTITVSASLDSICIGDSTTLSASGAVNYIWTPNIALNTNIGSVVDAGPTSSITYTVTGTDALGCVNSNTVAITVNPILVVTITAGSQTLCFGDSTLLTASGATTYSWSPSSGLSATTGSQVYAQPPTTTTYTVIGSDGIGCSSSQTITITVNPLPNVSAVANPPLICQGQTSVLTASGANSYSWTPPTGLSSTVGTIVNANPTTSIVYAVTGTDVNGCVNTNTVSLTVDSLPVVSVIATSDSLCFGSSTDLTASGALTYLWTPPTYLNVTFGANVVSTPASTITYIVTGTDAAGCQSSANINITVNPIPVVDAGTDQDICVSSAPFNLTGNSPSGGTWTGVGITNNIAGTFDPSVSGVGSFVLTYIYIDPITSCEDSSSKIMNVHPLPVVSFTVNALGCTNAPTNFTNTTTGAVSYTWFFGDGGTSTAINPTYSYSNAGTYTVTLIAQTLYGCIDSSSTSITINTPPTSSFTISNSGCAPDIASFTNTSIGNLVSYFWDFGNGNTSNLQNPGTQNYIQGQYGDSTYYITLIASNYCGSSTYIDSVVIDSIPVITFGTNVSIGCSPLTILISTINVSYTQNYLWSFGDGTFSNLANPGSHVYTTGLHDTTYTMTVIASNACGSDTASQVITVLSNNVNAFFNTNPTSGCIPLTVDFTDFSINALSLQWNFGDGNFSTLTNPVHTYNTAAIDTVYEIASNGCGSDTASIIITAYGNPNINFFMFPPDSVCANSAVMFSNVSTNLAASHWEFGNGDTSNLTNPVYVYTNPGNYTITLSGVTPVNGCADSMSRMIHVIAAPVNNISSSIQQGCQPFTVNFVDNTINSTNQYWNFGDGNSSALPNPFNIYLNPGTDTVTFISYNNLGCSDTSYLTITVYPLPVANFTLTPLNSCTTPTTVDFTNQSFGAVSYAWNFGNGQTATTTNGQATYTTPGVFTITLVSTTTFNCSDSTQSTFTLYPQPVANFTASPDSGCSPLIVDFNNLSTNATNYEWFFGTGDSSNQMNPSYLYANGGTYSVTLIAENGPCVDSVTQNNSITVFPKPVAGFTYTPYLNPNPTGIIIFNNNSTGADSYVWNFGDSTSSTSTDPTHQYQYPGEYLVTLYAIYNSGCMDVYQELIVVDYFKSLYVPNALVANGPDEVKIFLPKGKGLLTYHLQIFNKWGTLIWETTKLQGDGSPAEGWDGTFNGVPCQQDAYVWKIDAIFQDGFSWQGVPDGNHFKTTGTINLLR